MNSTEDTLIIQKLERLFSKHSKQEIYDFIEVTPREELLKYFEKVVSSKQGIERLKEDRIFSEYFFNMLSSLLFKIQSQETRENERIESPFSKSFYNKIDEIISPHSAPRENEYVFK